MAVKTLVYTTSTCKYCPMVKKLLSKKNIPYIEKNADEPEIRAEAIKVSGAMTVPVVFYNGQIVIGWNPQRLAQITS